MAALAKREGTASELGYGLYLDSPKQVSQNELRSEMGLLLQSADAGTRAKLLKAGLKVTDWPKQQCLAVDFPRRTALSFAIGAIRAYPALDRALPAGASVSGPALEVYGSETITYLFPIHF